MTAPPQKDREWVLSLKIDSYWIWSVRYNKNNAINYLHCFRQLRNVETNRKHNEKQRFNYPSICEWADTPDTTGHTISAVPHELDDSIPIEEIETITLLKPTYHLYARNIMGDTHWDEYQ